MYDVCTKVSEKREIARQVVEAVYANGGRFLDAEGNDVGFKKSMDKAMKALKDRRHIKSRKQGVVKPLSQEAIQKAVQIKRATTANAKEKDPLTTDDAGHALLLLRMNSESGSAKPRSDGEVDDDTNMMPPPRPTDARTQHAKQQENPRLEWRNTAPRFGRIESTNRAYQLSRINGSGGAPPLTAKNRETDEQPKDSGSGGTPVMWQNVIVSRESPQASLSDMLVNAKQRLDALSSIQQAVSAPICLIYPPNPNISLTGQVTIGQVAVPRAPRTGVQQVSLQG